MAAKEPVSGRFIVDPKTGKRKHVPNGIDYPKPKPQAEKPAATEAPAKPGKEQ